MKKFEDLKVGDTVYKVIYANDSNYPVWVRKEKVTTIEIVDSGTVIKTEEIVEEGILHGTHGYFVDSYWYNAECIGEDRFELWWDKFAVQELINNIAVECQTKFSEMLNVLKD